VGPLWRSLRKTCGEKRYSLVANYGIEFWESCWLTKRRCRAGACRGADLGKSEPVRFYRHQPASVCARRCTPISVFPVHSEASPSIDGRTAGLFVSARGRGKEAAVAVPFGMDLKVKIGGCPRCRSYPKRPTSSASMPGKHPKNTITAFRQRAGGKSGKQGRPA